MLRFVPILLCFGWLQPAGAADGAVNSAYTKVVQTTDALFSNKTLLGEDGVRQVFGKLQIGDVSANMVVQVTLADGSSHEVRDYMSPTEQGALVVEFVDGVESGRYLASIHLTGNLWVVPEHANTSKFVSRECRVRDERTVCHKNMRNDDGTLQVVVYKQLHP